MLPFLLDIPPVVMQGARLPGGHLTLSIIVPVYNEVRLVREALRRVAPVPVRKEIVVVDDCSNDATTALLTELARDPWPVVYCILRHGLVPPSGLLPAGGLPAPEAPQLPEPLEEHIRRSA